MGSDVCGRRRLPASAGQGPQVKHILGASAYAARAAEIVADDDRSVSAEHLKRMMHRATPVVVDVLKRFPTAPDDGGRVGELIRMLDVDLRTLTG
ncbi:hypothetical protein ACLGIH_33720 [Streptomyces sp. HMX87]|uniref:hypothetical protein n=1 Tax=Streptomyces sp. HMX87 TaxID=3390849 RepID=UPI003A8AE0DC